MCWRPFIFLFGVLVLGLGVSRTFFYPQHWASDLAYKKSQYIFIELTDACMNECVHFSYLHLNFLICKIGIIVIPIS